MTVAAYYCCPRTMTRRDELPETKTAYMYEEPCTIPGRWQLPSLASLPPLCFLLPRDEPGLLPFVLVAEHAIPPRLTSARGSSTTSIRNPLVARPSTGHLQHGLEFDIARTGSSSFLFETVTLPVQVLRLLSPIIRCWQLLALLSHSGSPTLQQSLGFDTPAYSPTCETLLEGVGCTKPPRSGFLLLLGGCCGCRDRSCILLHI